MAHALRTRFRPFNLLQMAPLASGSALARIQAAEMAGPPNRSEASADSDVPSARTFVDSEGSRWRVYEQPFSDYDRRSGVSLIFSSEGAVRRVRNYPPNWSELSDRELMALSWKA
jgi:hypothetical protein